MHSLLKNNTTIRINCTKIVRKVNDENRVKNRGDRKSSTGIGPGRMRSSS
jgi:hypothetical protein